MLNGSGLTASSDTQWKKSPCRYPDDKSQSVDVSDMTMRHATKTPQINAMTFNGRVMVIVSIVVVGAMAVGEGCRSLDVCHFCFQCKEEGIKS